MEQTLLDRFDQVFTEGTLQRTDEMADNRLAAKSMSNVELPTLPLLALLWDHCVGVSV